MTSILKRDSGRPAHPGTLVVILSAASVAPLQPILPHPGQFARNAGWDGSSWAGGNRRVLAPAKCWCVDQFARVDYRGAGERALGAFQTLLSLAEEQAQQLHFFNIAPLFQTGQSAIIA